MNASHLACTALLAALLTSCATPHAAESPAEPPQRVEEPAVAPPQTEPPERVDKPVDPAQAISNAQSAIAEAEDDAHYEAIPNATLDDLTIAFTPAEYPIVKEPRPTTDSKGCGTGFREFDAAFAANNRAYEYRAADSKGWRRLAHVRTDGMGSAPNRPEDQLKGTEWKVVGVTGCGPVPDFYIDAEHNVFQVYPENSGCSRTKEIKLCGVWGIPGCGRKPPEYNIYALVPADAKILQHTRAVKLPTRQCYRPNPTGGISRPG